MTDPRPSHLTRRTTLGALVAAPAGLALPARAQEAAPPTASGGMCLLPVEAVEGPFYFDPKLERSDVTEGRPGVPLELNLTVVDAATCAPLVGARVDLWHADAGGLYSGYPAQGGPGGVSTEGETFMRGSQTTGSDGSVTFRTVYPGWYRGRTPHIHVKALLNAREALTTQLYFPDALSEYVFEHVTAYGGRGGARDTVNATDGVLRSTAHGRTTFLNLREDTDRYVGTLTIAADRNAAPVVQRRGPPPPPGGRPDGPPPGGRMPEMMRRPDGPLVPGTKA
ncbi:intradiol ring-cleavage dioxygenase [Methylopila sp. 73B]|uniref:intradiol ring-cleavage dioxygenase n=1 Tax=Methylopila sp. 73B TaxID=1120792 RepID=UPI0003825E23|nr:intradiol ring-cleavage dioxygenase [Methylopila sp. 73B]